MCDWGSLRRSYSDFHHSVVFCPCHGSEHVAWVLGSENGILFVVSQVQNLIETSLLCDFLHVQSYSSGIQGSMVLHSLLLLLSEFITIRFMHLQSLLCWSVTIYCRSRAAKSYI